MNLTSSYIIRDVKYVLRLLINFIAIGCIRYITIVLAPMESIISFTNLCSILKLRSINLAVANVPTVPINKQIKPVRNGLILLS